MSSTIERVLFLQRLELFSRLSSDELAAVARIADVVAVSDGESVFSEGDDGDSLFFIVRGSVRIHTRTSQADVELAVLPERAVFGEMALFDDEPRSATATAVGDCELLMLERGEFHELLLEKPQIGIGIIQVLSRRLRESMNRRRQDVESSMPRPRPA
jgi:CRP-like cAMP-binding protein